ncbi:MAG: tRNA (N6-isopentenyl adenosine(37)-C2)-methylthiotransferase MiaB [Alphaproteobacteria bacterium]|nr:tRNA (N6-isopentenyl adenosine(37)-C2)-methylthiotransferase MiaB [Alphaproteobacteria bacterium]
MEFSLKKIYIKTFGCQMNAYDSARMRDAMAVHGYQETENPSEADILLLNTCHIREKASEKLFSEIGRLNEFKKARKQEGKDTLIVVCGCVVQAEGAEILKRSHPVDIALGPQNYHRLPELVAAYNRKNGRVLLADFPSDSKFDYLPKTKATSASSFLAVQEGCDNFCTYCVVPYTRGCEYSRPASDILKEAQELVSTGAKEIMLLGQNVNCWHGDGASDLGDLINQLAQIEGLERIRYTTSYPSKITQNLIDAHAKLDKLMPYIHLPIQSGSDVILKAMNRQYTAKSYEEIVAMFRKARPDIAVSSDFIVGFPGETDDDFAQTMEVVKRVRYASSFSFKYSPRPGTPAALMKNQVPEDIKTKRLMILQAELLKQQQEFNSQTVGKILPVLLTERGKKEGQLVGYTPYLQGTHVSLPDTFLNQIVMLEITDASATSLTGVKVD